MQHQKEGLENQSRWQPIDPDLIADDLGRDPGASLVQVTLSPYDIPEAVRSFYDDDRDAWVIEFRYFGDHEQSKALPPREGVSIHVGKDSGRLYSIEINAAKSAGGLRIYANDIDKAIASLVGNQKQWRLTQHFKIARKILAKKDALALAS